MARTEQTSRWLFHPATDLLFGCGLLYVVLFVGWIAVGAEARASQPYYLFPVLVLVLSTPHYGAES